jgi:hypothetical protein
MQGILQDQGKMFLHSVHAWLQVCNGGRLVCKRSKSKWLQQSQYI